MKLSAFLTVLILATGTAAAGQAATWAPAATAETLNSFKLPAAAGPASSRPHDGENYSGAEEVLIKEFGVMGISLDIPETEVAAQTRGYANNLCFEQALRMSLKSFFEDYSSPSSPLAAILTSMGVQAGKPSKSEVKTAGRKLFQLMNMPGAALALVRNGDSVQAAHGETVKENWVFRLRLNYSDTSYWAVADRLAVTPAYNY